MDLSKAEIKKLKQAKEVFKIQKLNRQQVEVILGRKITDKTWQAYVTSESRKHKNIKDTAYSAKRLFRVPSDKPHFNY